MPNNPAEQIIAIGASIGGIEATLRILKQLPDDIPGIVIVQHMPKEFTGSYAAHLDSSCKIRVREAKSGDIVAPGTAWVAPGGEQLRICKTAKGFAVIVGGNEKVSGFCPSVDVLFKSVALNAGKMSTGVLLSGMGRDGANGIKMMRDCGAYTIGQNEQSCTVFGMPHAAWEIGGIIELLQPFDIARRLTERYSGQTVQEKLVSLND